jgi:hypothetical protein
MNPSDMRALVKEELNHIPPGAEPQNMLRMAYWTLRMNSLGKRATGAKEPYDVLRAAIAHVRAQHADHEFHYDRPFFEGTSALEGYYHCKVTPKALEEDSKAVQRVGHQLLKLRNEETDRRVGPIAFEGVSAGKFSETLLDLINGKDSRAAWIRFARADYTPGQLSSLLKRYFPKRTVRDVTVDDRSIFDTTEE